MACNGKLVGLN